MRALSTVNMAAAPNQQQISAIRRVQPDGSVLFTGTDLRLRVALLKPAFMLITVVGAAKSIEDRAVEYAVLRELDLELDRSGMLTIFCDLREMTRLAAESRDAFGSWGKRHQKRINASHVLIRSKLIEMATTLISVLAGGVLKTYTRPQVFLEAIRAVAPKLTALPELEMHSGTIAIDRDKPPR